MKAASLQLIMTDYTAAVVIQVLLIAVLVTVLLIGTFLVLNLGMLSKRQEDRIGGRAPSEVGFLQSTNWPEKRVERRVLQAEEEEEDTAA